MCASQARLVTYMKRYRRVLMFNLCVLLIVSAIISISSPEKPVYTISHLSRACEPQKKIAFLKTHKCASSTIQNILFRFGEAHQLKFVFPRDGNYLGKSNHFNRNMIERLPWHPQGYDIFAVHTVWDYQEVLSVLGEHPRPTFISIVREPVDLFESLYSFAQWDKLFNMDINDFSEVVNRSMITGNFMNIGGYAGRNQMMHDFGLLINETIDKAVVRDKIESVGRHMDLVMIAEQLKESLVLMADLLCWSLEDVAALEVNARYPQYKSTLLPETRKILKNWLWADQMLYDYFKRAFQEKKLKYGQARLESATDILNEIDEKIKERCVVVEKNFNQLGDAFRPSSVRVKGFCVAKTKECEDFARNELAYIDLLRDRQVGHAGLNVSAWHRGVSQRDGSSRERVNMAQKEEKETDDIHPKGYVLDFSAEEEEQIYPDNEYP